MHTYEVHYMDVDGKLGSIELEQFNLNQERINEIENRPRVAFVFAVMQDGIPYSTGDNFREIIKPKLDLTPISE